MGSLCSRDKRRGNEVSSPRQTHQSGQRPLAADETLPAARHSDRRELMAKIARVVTPEDHPPRLRIEFQIPQRGERYSDLKGPSVIANPSGRVPEKIGGAVFSAASVIHDGVE